MQTRTLAVFLLVAGCAGSPPTRETMATPRFSPATFFDGRTEGVGRLKKMLSASEDVRVEGRGRVAADGMIILDQTVAEGKKPPKRREWLIREMAPGRYSGTLSDAVGAVTGDVIGNRLHLQFRLKGNLDAQQWLYLQPDSRSARNHMVVRKFGIVVATLDETIRKSC